MKLCLNVVLPVMAISLLGAESAFAQDAGESRGMQYYQQHRHDECRMVPRFADKAGPIGTATQDPEKDTIAYPVSELQQICGR